MKDTAPLARLQDPPEQENEESAKMTFLEHLDELRKRLTHVIAYLGIGFVVCFYFHKPLYDFLAIPFNAVAPAGKRLVYTNLTDPFTMYMKVAFVGGIFLTIPFTLYEVWKFIAPGLYRKEKRYVVPFLVSSVFLFVSGGLFCYWIVLPQAYKFLIDFGSSFDPMVKIDEYFDLTTMMILGFGLVFEMPVIVAFLSLFGLVSAGFLWRNFKYSIVLIVALAAMLSPTGDAFNLAIWAAPMVLLYVISIGVAAIFGWRRKRQGLV
jgi:sec-independent protein translocase protein TatC